MKTVAFVPVKLNNQRMPGKNIRRFDDGTALITAFLQTLVKVNGFDAVYVFCSDDTIKQYLIPGVRFLKRPPYLDTQQATPQMIMQEFIDRVEADIYAVCHCTSPFVTKEHFEECLTAVKSGKFDSSFTAERVQRLMWTDKNTPLNFEPDNVPRTQDLSVYYNEVSAVYAFKKEVFEKYKRRIGEHPHITEVSGIECVDIDYPEDFEIANTIYMKMLRKETERQKMNHAMLLDCTLRDGAYLVDKHFGDDVINGIIAGLVDAGTDIIEIGFLQDDGFGPGKTVFLNSRAAKKFIPENRGGSMFAVLADFSRYSIENLDPYDGTSFDAVRICFFKGERYEAVEYFKAVKAKGYKLFVQPVDILGYTDMELVELLEMVNQIEPFCFSIVDTFGSMYEEDLDRVFSLVDHNLCPAARIGFHSHNNMQMSGALSQAFLNMTAGRRDVVVDATVSGMGRGAGNTPTELIAQYMVSRLQYHYDIDALLDVIDNYISPIRMRVKWGYDTDMFLTGAYSAHVNNIVYLKKKNSIRSKDIRFILNKIGPVMRKRYHYDLLENTYLELVSADVDDSRSIAALAKKLAGRSVVMVMPGKTVEDEKEQIAAYIREHNAVVISVNFEPQEFAPAYLYMSNVNRYTAYRQKRSKSGVKKILTSNVKAAAADGEYIVTFQRLYKCGWQFGDNSAILLLRLLDVLDVHEIGIAGLDGYNPESFESNNYINKTLERPISGKMALEVNREIKEMLNDYFATRRNKAQVRFITTSRFDIATGGGTASKL